MAVEFSVSDELLERLRKHGKAGMTDAERIRVLLDEIDRLRIAQRLRQTPELLGGDDDRDGGKGPARHAS